MHRERGGSWMTPVRAASAALLLLVSVAGTQARMPPPSHGGLRCPSEAVCDLLVCVQCNYADFRSRELHRLTYMRYLPQGIDVIFLLDMPQHGDEGMDQTLKAEHEMHKDTYVLPYRATGDPGKDRGEVPYKTYSFLRWAAAQNVLSNYRFIAKCDTDSLLNPYAVRHRIHTLTLKGTVYGRKLETDLGKQSFFYGGAYYMFSADVVNAIAIDNAPKKDVWKLAEDQFFARMVKDHVGEAAHHVDAGIEICSPAVFNDMWSANVTEQTLVVHGMKNTSMFVQVWAEVLPFVRAAALETHKQHAMALATVTTTTTPDP